MNGSSLSQYNEVMRYTFHVDSAKRNSGTNTDLNLTLTQPLTRLSADGQFIVSITSISIPFSFYQLSSTENLNVLPVFLKNTLDVSGRTTTVTLNQGNYTPYTLLSELHSRLTVACQQTGISGFTPFTPTFNSTYNTVTGYITFVLTGPAGCEIHLLFATSTVTGLLGNFFGVGETNVVMTTSTTPVSTKPCVLNPVNYLYLRSSLKQYRNREWVVQSDDVSDILHRIPIGTSQGTWIQYDVSSEPIYIVDASIETINFYLTTNLTYEAINLQGIDWSFSFSISEVARPKYTPITTTLAYNNFQVMSQEDRQKTIDELEQKKQKELDRLIRYRARLAGQTTDDDLKTVEAPADAPKADGAQKEDLKEPETQRTPDEALKSLGVMNQSTAKLEEFANIIYGSLWDPPTVRQAGDVLGLSLNPLPPVEDTTADTDSPITN